MFAAPSTGPANAAAAAASLAAADRDDEVRSEMAEELSQLRSELGAAERSILVMARERDEVVEALGVAQGALAAADGRGGGEEEEEEQEVSESLPLCISSNHDLAAFFISLFHQTQV